MSETDTILWAEQKRAMAQNYLSDGSRLQLDVFNSSIETAIRLVKMGYKLTRRKAWDKDGFFTIDISNRCTVFFNIPVGYDESSPMGEWDKVEKYVKDNPVPENMKTKFR